MVILVTMPKPIATIQWDKCHPDQHDEGKCPASEACPRKVLKQEAPGEPPMPLGLCRGCGACLAACPFQAILLR
jgi:translation initiation factor RLI1